jgi:hypothetical protein
LKRALTLLILLTLGTSVWAASPASPGTNAVHPGLFELGLTVGQPTGLSLKVWFDRTSALEAIASWDFTQLSLFASADYHFVFPDVLRIQEVNFPLFVGVGGMTSIGPGSAVNIGLRVPLGILFVFAKVPLEIQLEAVPGMYVFPATSFVPMGALAIRYCF